MGLDSLELVLAWEETFSIEITEAEGRAMLTPRSAVDLIYHKLKSPLPEDGGSLTLRAFLRLRAALVQEGMPGSKVGLDAKISEILSGPNRRDSLARVMSRAGLRPLPKLPFGLQFTFGHVRDLVTGIVIEQHRNLRRPGHGWSRSQVREVIRAVMFAQLALRRFSDDARFVKDLGID
jgi:hypothetical protein